MYVKCGGCVYASNKKKKKTVSAQHADAIKKSYKVRIWPLLLYFIAHPQCADQYPQILCITT